MMVERVTSRQNPLLRHAKKLLASKSYRESCGEYVADGIKLLEEAARWDTGLHTVIASDTAELCTLPAHIRLVRVPDDVMASISMMQSPQGALFLGALPRKEQLRMQGGSLIAEGIQDPGNLGTILRTADALDVPVVLTEGCADPYNPKTIRASMGSVFRTHPQSAARKEIIALCKEKGITLTATALSSKAMDIRNVDLQNAAVIIGSEGQGISEIFLQEASQAVVIPMNPKCESLNAAIAAAIVMWQIKR